MRTRCYALLLSTLIVCPVTAQVIYEQTVQLPTFHFFGVSTTVVVPTQGTVSLGSIGGSTRTRFDRVGSSFVEANSFTGGLTMNATVIDFAEMDRAVLAEAARRRGADFDILGRPVSLSSIVHESAESQLGAKYLRRGRNAEATGQPEAARVFYRRVLKHGTRRERQIAEERLEHIDGALAAQVNEKLR